MKQKPFQIEAQGNSMYPILKNGDVVECVKTPFSRIRVNDVIIHLKKENIFVTHRVIYRTKHYLVTRGDNNIQADEYVYKNAVFAKVVRFSRKGQWYGIADIYMNQSVLYLREIKKLESLLQKSAVPHVFLKGVLISLRYKSTIPRRIYADCDVLIARHSFGEVRSIFERMGYRMIGDPTLGFAPERDLYSHPEVTFLGVQGQVAFDLHFEPVFLSARIGSAMEFLYPQKRREQLGAVLIQNAHPFRLRGMIYPILSPIHQVLYLALHLFHHNYVDIIPYHLLAVVIKKVQRANRDMWDQLLLIIRAYDMGSYVYGVFIVLERYGLSSIPSSFIRSIRPAYMKEQIILFYLTHINLFENEQRVRAGIIRFIGSILLSPTTWWWKIIIFFHPATYYSLGRMISSIYNSPKKPHPSISKNRS